MPVDRYGVLKGRPLEWRPERDSRSPHFQIRVRADGADCRVTVNVRSSLSPPDLLYHRVARFRHPITGRIAALDDGFVEPLRIAREGGGLALDYLRQDLASRRLMRPAPHSAPGPHNDLNDFLVAALRLARADPEARLYAFGSAWGPERQRDHVFDFRPGRGVHNVHMNQGNAGRFRRDDGAWQDGALLFHLPSERRWQAIFLAFQSQCWRTDGATGHCLPAAPRPD